MSGFDRSLERLTAAKGVRRRDCRTCKHFRHQEDGLSYGWCRAHRQFVKLYHPKGAFFSQCQFKALVRLGRPGSRTLTEASVEPTHA